MHFFSILFPFFSAILGYSIAAWYWYTPPVRIPDVRGMVLRDGLCLLSRAGFSADYCELSYEGESVIVDQSPSGGVLSKQHRSVRVMVPAARKKEVMPDCLGMRLDAPALCQFSHHTITLPSDLPAGTVIGQYPAADEAIKSPILIVAAPKSSRVIVPSWIGEHATVVRDSLELSGISLDSGGLSFCDECVVVNQWPLPGSSIDRATLTHLFCSFSCTRRHR
jgi:beta-lactam-binding protein with PASTA domain